MLNRQYFRHFVQQYRFHVSPEVEFDYTWRILIVLFAAGRGFGGAGMTGKFIRQITATLIALCTAILVAACDPGAENASEGGSDNTAVSAPAPDAANGGSKAATAEREVVAEELAYAEVDEQLAKGHFVFPEDMVDSLPAVILIHEWWGLDDRMRSIADRIAAQGFVVLAIDLYGGKTTNSPADARLLMLTVVEHPEYAAQNIRQAYDWLLESTGAKQVGVVGYGFGGGWSLNAAVDLPQKLDAAVIFYGQVSDNEEVIAEIDAPLLGFFGREDKSIPANSVERFESVLENLGKDYKIELYSDAKAGFASPGNRNFDKALAQKSWNEMLKFLHQHLTNAGDSAT